MQAFLPGRPSSDALAALDVRVTRHPEWQRAVDARPEWLPEGYEHVQVTREEVWEANWTGTRGGSLALRPMSSCASFRNPPEQYHGDVRFRSLCHVADLIAEPDDV